MPLVQTRGAASAQGFGEFAVAATPTYIEDVFSCFLYTGNASTQTITNGIDLSTKGGLVWTKSRTNANEALIYDTVRGVNNYIIPSSTQEAQTSSATLTAFNSNGFTLGANDNSNDSTTDKSVGWTFRKQPKFFDIVTWTGNDVIGREIPHNLGSVPACIMVKQTNATRAWVVYHVGIGNTKYLTLNSTSGAGTQSFFNNTTPTSTVFTVGDWGAVNGGGNTYVAYLFAHNAGGFGLTGTDNVISCGSYTTNSSAVASVTLGYEPQWLLIKRTDAGGFNWEIRDVMRGYSMTGAQALAPNSSAVEYDSTGALFYPTATGFVDNGSQAANATFIYIAIRRGPMKVPTSGTSVFSPNLSAATTGDTVTTGFPLDLQIAGYRPGLTPNFGFSDRLRGISSTSTEVAKYLTSTSTNAESTAVNFRTLNWGNTGYNQDGYLSGTGAGIYWNLRRAPSFFDEVCYTGTGNVGSDATRITHNLGVAPELIIVKGRTNAVGWPTYTATGGVNSLLLVNATDASSAITGIWATTAPTSTTFGVSNGGGTYNNGGGVNYVAYLFATCAGVSKVGSYTGTGTTKQVDCGFTSGARFVLIKRTDSTGDWYVWDSARGIVAGNDPYLLLNSTAAEVTSTDYVDTYSAGFEISSTAPAAINASGGTFIFLAIA